MRSPLERSLALWSGIAAPALLLLAGCAGVPQQSGALLEARTLYRQAAAIPSVQEHAPTELALSQQALARAEAADSYIEMNHQSYLAAQHARIAMEVAVQRNAEAQIDAMSAEREVEHREALARVHTETASAEAELAAMEARHTDRGYVVTLNEIAFRPGSADLRPGADPRIAGIAEYLRHNPERRVLVEGYTDDVGAPERNQELSERRAAAVEQALVQEGIPERRIGVRGYGASYPIADNGLPEGRAQNRRVEVVILDPARSEVSPVTRP